MSRKGIGNWSDSEDALVRRGASFGQTDVEISAQLEGRSLNAVRRRRCRLGLADGSNAKIEWNPTLDNDLHHRRIVLRLSWRAIGAAMGISPKTCWARGQELGFPRVAKARKATWRDEAAKAEIVVRRQRGETYAQIAAALGIAASNAYRIYTLLMSSAAGQAATEVRHGPNTRAAGSPSAVSATLNVPPETGPVASRQRGVLLQGGASK